MFGQEMEEISSILSHLEAMWPHLVPNSCILHFIATGPQHQVKDFQPLFICDFQSFTSEGENPQTENVSLLVINFSSFFCFTDLLDQAPKTEICNQWHRV